MRLVLYQMRRRVRNALTITRLDDRNRSRILIQNGFAAKLYLPHAMEYALFETVERMLKHLAPEPGIGVLIRADRFLFLVE